MSATVLDMSISVDGFVAGPNAGPGNGLGDGGERLHEWLFGGTTGDHQPLEVSESLNGRVLSEVMSTGAVVAGRGTFEPADGWGGDHHDGVPIFVYSRREPGIDISGWPRHLRRRRANGDAAREGRRGRPERARPRSVDRPARARGGRA